MDQIQYNNSSSGVHQDPGPGHTYIRRETGLYTSPYLDDFLAKDKEKSFLVYKSKEMIQFMLDVGLRINRESQN